MAGSSSSSRSPVDLAVLAARAWLGSMYPDFPEMADDDPDFLAARAAFALSPVAALPFVRSVCDGPRGTSLPCDDALVCATMAADAAVLCAACDAAAGVPVPPVAAPPLAVLAVEMVLRDWLSVAVSPVPPAVAAVLDSPLPALAARWLVARELAAAGAAPAPAAAPAFPVVG